MNRCKTKRKKKAFSRDYLPVGTIRIRSRARGDLKVRMIKIRNDGPKSRRWVNWARYWWEMNRGPVPAGKRVAHLDGNSMNDDPCNLALLDAGDIVYLAHERDHDMSRENYRKCREATARINAENARQRRLTEIQPRRWYPLDPKRGIVFNRPRRMRWQVYQIFGVKPTSGRTDPEWESAALGWPELPMLQAQILGTLVLGSSSYLELLGHVNAYRLLIGRQQVSLHSIYAAAGLLRKKGLVCVHKNGALIIGATEKARANRTRYCKVVVIRGSEIGPEYEKRGWICGRNSP